MERVTRGGVRGKNYSTDQKYVAWRVACVSDGIVRAMATDLAYRRTSREDNVSYRPRTVALL